MQQQKDPFHSLATRLSLGIILLGTLIFIGVLGSNYVLSRNLLEQYVGELARTTAASTVNEIESVFSSVATSADSLAAIVIKADISEQQIQDAIRAFLKINRDIYGMAVALEPNVLQTNIGQFAPYYFRNDSSLSYTDLAVDEYRYLTWDWYQQPKTVTRPVWTEPYYDRGGGNVLMTTYSTPLLIADQQPFAGVATADISLDWLQQLVANIQILETGFGLIVSQQDTVVAHPDQSRVMKKLKSTLDSGFIEHYWDKYVQSKRAQQASYFHAPCRHEQGDCWIAIKPLLDTGWKVVIIIPESELSYEIMLLTGEIALLALVGLVVLVLVIITHTRNMINPLERLASVTAAIGSGNLDVKLPGPSRNDEIGALTTDFRNMRDSLRTHIEQLRQTTAKQQKLESEIEIASNIQMSMLPGGGTVSILDQGYQLYAQLRPARSVGGDLYFYQHQENKLDFIVGDVSDKGVPAALFMAKAVTLYTGAPNEDLSPGDTLARMNLALSQNNDACMFVTALCGRLDLATGELIMANAGHMHPLQKTQDRINELSVDGGTALGLMENVDYPNVVQVLAPQTSLLLYTDGITEAFNTAGEQYHDERLFTIVAHASQTTAESLGSTVLADVDAFVDKAKQSDDITLMVIHYGH
ncbi:MAG: SpoIIE family protein phosphatase [Gammaproteobacteria bacterium]|nr:SpoIIE family protein phosphatase [Gammaproteobacteria bacterium]